MNIDEILSNQDNNYESIKDILENYDEDNYYKILFSINKFKEQDMKIICKKIIINSLILKRYRELWISIRKNKIRYIFSTKIS